jgi:hypothetical protein
LIIKRSVPSIFLPKLLLITIYFQIKKLPKFLGYFCEFKIAARSQRLPTGQKLQSLAQFFKQKSSWASQQVCRLARH